MLALLLDKKNRLWVGTFGGGLNCLNGDFKSFRGLSNLVITKNEGLCDNNVVSLLEDANGNIWAATYSGISCYRVAEETFQNFFEEDGLTNNEFNYASAMKDAAGHLWFGGMNGINVLDLKAVSRLEKNPPVCLTAFTKYDSRRDTTVIQVIGNQKIERFVISPHVAWFQFNWTARHTGEFNGIPASGNSVEVSFLGMFHIVNGKVLSSHVEFNPAAIMAEVGAVPVTA